jgi:hypothetical protein
MASAPEKSTKNNHIKDAANKRQTFLETCREKIPYNLVKMFQVR